MKDRYELTLRLLSVTEELVDQLGVLLAAELSACLKNGSGLNGNELKRLEHLSEIDNGLKDISRGITSLAMA